MATETSQPQGKILFKRTDIVTMRKDIKMLREFDSRKEGEKVISPIVAKSAPVQAPPSPVKIQITSPQPVTVQANPQEKVLEQINQQDEAKMAQAKQYANEAEKQQIFAFESQITEIKNQIKSFGSEKEPTLNLEKNQILLKQEEQKRMLADLVSREEKMEVQIKEAEDKEGQTAVPSEKQQLEKERGILENQRQEVEKKRWAVEQELSKLESQITSLNTNYKEVGSQETALKEKIAGINNSLRAIYAGIIDRENKKNAELRGQQKMANTVKPKAPVPANPGPAIQKSYMKDIPAAAKEKLAETAQTENEQRRKFMEDIENWANSSEKKQ